MSKHTPGPVTIEIPDDTQVVYVKIAGHTVYIDVSMLETSGEFIVDHWDDDSKPA